MFGAIAYAVASSKAKDKDSKYGHLAVPSFFSRNFPRCICLEVVTLNTKLTVTGEYNKEQRKLSVIHMELIEQTGTSFGGLPRHISVKECC